MSPSEYRSLHVHLMLVFCSVVYMVLYLWNHCLHLSLSNHWGWQDRYVSIITFIIIYLFNTKLVKKNNQLLILNAGTGKNKLQHAEALRLISALCVNEHNWFIAEIETIGNFEEKLMLFKQFKFVYGSERGYCIFYLKIMFYLYNRKRSPTHLFS